MNPIILCADIGTSSLKAGLIREDGFVLNSTTIRFPQDKESIEHDKAEVWKNSFVKAAKTLLNANFQDLPSLGAICISGNGPSLVAKLKNGKSFSYLWYEKNNAIESDAFHGSIFLPRILSFENSYPEIISSATFISSGPEYLVHSLTDCEAFTLLPEKRFQSAYWTEEETDKIVSTKMKSLLPPFSPLGQQHGFLSKDFLEELNLPLSAKIPLLCGGPDFVAALIGTNTLEAGKICDRMGSSEGINVCTGCNTPDNHAASSSSNDIIRVMPSVIPGFWNKSVIIPKSGSILSAIKAESEYSNSTYEEYFSTLCKNAEKGNKLTPAIENLLKNVKEAYETLGVLSNYTASYITSKIQAPIICTGRQARSDNWLQLRANYLGLPLAKTTCPDSELMGNAIIALSALNEERNLKKISEQIVKIEKTYEPQ